MFCVSAPPDSDLDIVLEFSSPSHLNDELTLTIMRCDDSETLRLMKISCTKWEAIEDINLCVIRGIDQTDNAGVNMTKSSDQDAGDMTLIVSSKDGSDEAFLTLTEDEIYAMTCAEEGMLKKVFCPC